MKHIMTIITLLGVLIIAGATHQHAAAAPADTGYRYTFPTNPQASTMRRMMLNGCTSQDNRTWICPDAPPYTYGS